MRTLLLLLSLFVVACGSPPSGLAASLPGSSWTLERIVLADGTVLRGTGDQITFAPDGAFTMASCNQCTGRYAMREDALTIDAPLACTRRGCAPGAVELERFIGSSSTVRRDGTYLIIEPLAGEASQVLLVPAQVGG